MATRWPESYRNFAGVWSTTWFGSAKGPTASARCHDHGQRLLRLRRGPSRRLRPPEVRRVPGDHRLLAPMDLGDQGLGH